MASNDENIYSLHNVEEPIDSLVGRFNDCADFVSGVEEPVTDTQLVRVVCGLVINTGQYLEYCRAWR